MALQTADDVDIQPPTGATAPPFIVQHNPFLDIVLPQWLPTLTDQQVAAHDDTPLKYE
jgi:hypothetical protein